VSQESRTVFELRRSLQATERELHAVQGALREAEDRAERAERAAREAWAFAKGVIHRPKTSN
jgi:hypothetical protein